MIGRVILPSRKIAADRLADGVGFAGEIEQIVDELKHDAEIEAVLAQLQLARLADVAQHAADLRAAGEQIRGLAADDLEVLFLGEIDARRSW